MKPEMIFAEILEVFPNSYYAEDLEKVIIGVDAAYFDTETHGFAEIESVILNQQKTGMPDFAGVFGILAAGFITHFENIPEPDRENYFFPDAVFAEARAYVYFDKKTERYETYGEIEIDQFMRESAYFKRLKTDRRATLLTNLDAEKTHYFAMIERVKEYIRAGDAFQVVPSEQLMLETAYDAFAFYLDLSRNNPSPYMYYFPTPYGDIVGSSPEVLVRKTESEVYVAPIAGTRRRGTDDVEDKALAAELLADQKECAEHRMLIDLARNDVGRICQTGSVRVENSMHIEYFQRVMHIVSDVYGTLKSGVSPLSVVSSVFPAGTLSGAPKIRALEIIAELETVKRNIYSGAIGFFHTNGDIQLAIVIRSGFFEKGDENGVKKVFIQAGSGIVYDSNREDEYKEIVIKRASLYDLFELEGGANHDFND